MKRLCCAAGLLAALASLAYSPTTPLHAQGDGNAWTTIKGRIIWEGKAPPQDKIKVTVDKLPCTNCAKDNVLLDEEFLVNPKNKGLANVFVWLAPLEEGGKLPINPALNGKGKPVTIDQPCCMFVPRAVAIREGQEVIAKNSAAINHNIRWTGNPDINAGGNVTLPPGKSYTIPSLKAQKLPLMVECNIHGWMKGRIGVFDHPYFAVTDANGKFEIPQAPNGKYKLFIYHESGWRGGKEGRNGYPITIEGGKVMEMKDMAFNVKK